MEVKKCRLTQHKGFTPNATTPRFSPRTLQISKTLHEISTNLLLAVGRIEASGKGIATLSHIPQKWNHFRRCLI